MHQVRSYVFNYFNVIPRYGIGIGPGAGNPELSATQLPGIGAADLNTANQLLATLAGYVNSYVEQFNVTSRTSGFVPGAPRRAHLRENNFDLYFQDTWKALPRLSITTALRYAYFGVVNERDSLKLMPVVRNGNPIETVLSNATLDYAGDLNRPDRNNFAPSIGLAWDIFGAGKTTLRAGYGIYYVNDQNMVAVDATSFWNDGLTASSQKGGLAGRVSTSLPTIAVPSLLAPRTAADSLATDANSVLGLIDPNLRTPYVQHWTAGIQHAIGNMLLEARYVGKSWNQRMASRRLQSGDHSGKRFSR